MKTAICIASGPSLTQEDVDHCRGKGTVYTVKESWLMAPWADIMYAADTDWWDVEERWRGFEGKKITCCPHACKKFPELHHIGARVEWHWSIEQGNVATGGNSGFQIMNMAELDGHDKIILLGFDYGYDPGGDKHWWDKLHPRESRESRYANWLKHIDMAIPYIKAEVLNATRKTAITQFPMVNIKDVL